MTKTKTICKWKRILLPSCLHRKWPADDAPELPPISQRSPSFSSSSRGGNTSCRDEEVQYPSCRCRKGYNKKEKNGKTSHLYLKRFLPKRFRRGLKHDVFMAVPCLRQDSTSSSSSLTETESLAGTTPLPLSSSSSSATYDSICIENLVGRRPVCNNRRRHAAGAVGLLLLVGIVVVMMVWGRVCAIVWTSACLSLVPRRWRSPPVPFTPRGLRPSPSRRGDGSSISRQEERTSPIL